MLLEAIAPAARAAPPAPAPAPLLLSTVAPHQAGVGEGGASEEEGTSAAVPVEVGEMAAEPVAAAAAAAAAVPPALPHAAAAVSAAAGAVGPAAAVASALPPHMRECTCEEPPRHRAVQDAAVSGSEGAVHVSLPTVAPKVVPHGLLYCTSGARPV
jgi:hypothetical protein